MTHEGRAHGPSPRRRVGLLGGTFDPVHVAHLALARAALAHLALDELRFVPTGRSWQKARTGASAGQRIAMLQIALAGLPHTSIDERETRRAGPSYTIDTLIELRAQLGRQAALVWIIGSDQLRNLPSWHRWDELLEHAHLAVARRAGDALEELDARVRALVDARLRDELGDAPAGSIVFFPMPAMQVSGSVLREQIARGERPVELLPAGVLDYIDRNRLYRAASGTRLPATRRNRMDPRKLQRVVVDALDDVKAQDIRVFDTTAQTELFDRVIIATGTSNRQTRALASHVRDKVKEAGAPIISVEGADTGEWVLVDLGDIVVHVMQPTIRQYYNLEELWGAKPVRLRTGERTPAAAKAPRAAGQGAAAPAEPSAALEQRAVAPAKRTSPPAKRTSSPAKRTASPAKRTSSPAKRTTSPTKQTASPAKRATSPAKRAAAPAAKRAPAKRAATKRSSNT